MEVFEITKYRDIFLRRKYWIIIPFLCTLLAGLTYAMTTPRMYQGETLILVVPQKVPENYVRSIVQMGMEERLRTIKQQVTSRTNLEGIIEDYQLFNGPAKSKMALQEKVDLFRKRIGVNVSHGNAFTITFRDEDAGKAKEVTNRLASNFIAENLKIREGQAIGTSEFLADEVESVRRSLEDKEEQIKQYRQNHMGAMPENLSTNLSILGRLQNQLEQLDSNLRAAEERKLIIQQQIANADMMQKQVQGIGISDSAEESGIPITSSSELISLKNQLASVETRYTANHPDVRRLKEMIEKIEARESQSEGEASELDRNATEEEFTAGYSMPDLLRPQLAQVNLEIKNLKAERLKIKSQAALYEKRIEETPQREQEMISIKRDYDNRKGLYDSLLERKLEAEIALSMEKKQKGEQFRVIDPAKFPERPVRPNIRKILLLAFILGLGLGGGLAFVAETLDTSYDTPEELEEELQMPVLVSMPFRYTEKELKTLKLKEIFKAASVAFSFALLSIGILIATKGVDKTLDYFKGLIDRI